MSSKEAEILRSAADLIEERGWCTKCCAKDSSGHSVDYASPQATRWCVVGSVKLVVNQERWPSSTALSMEFSSQTVLKRFSDYLRLVRQEREDNPSVWNDTVAKDKRRVVRTLRKAAEWIDNKNPTSQTS